MVGKHILTTHFDTFYFSGWQSTVIHTCLILDINKIYKKSKLRLCYQKLMEQFYKNETLFV